LSIYQSAVARVLQRRIHINILRLFQILSFSVYPSSFLKFSALAVCVQYTQFLAHIFDGEDVCPVVLYTKSRINSTSWKIWGTTPPHVGPVPRLPIFYGTFGEWANMPFHFLSVKKQRSVTPHVHDNSLQRSCAELGASPTDQPPDGFPVLSF